MLAAKALHSSKTFAAVPVCATLMSAMGRKRTLGECREWVETGHFEATFVTKALVVEAHPAT
jgi:hypothetical protein